MEQLRRCKHTHVDHSHKTGRVRGLLCVFCNAAAGFCADNPERAGLLMLYLEIENAKDSKTS